MYCLTLSFLLGFYVSILVSNGGEEDWLVCLMIDLEMIYIEPRLEIPRQVRFHHRR